MISGGSGFKPEAFPYTSEVTGTACVSEDGKGIIFTGSLKGFEDSVTGGFHIHAGTSCDDNTS